MFDAPIGEGANLFINIVLGIIAFATALIHVNIFKEYNKKTNDEKRN